MPGLINRSDYLTKLGWYMNEARVLVRAFEPNLAAFTAEERSTTLSVDDLVKHCYDTGYVMEIIQPGKIHFPTIQLYLLTLSS